MTISALEANPHACQFVDVRRLHVFLSIAAEARIEIVNDNQEYIRCRLPGYKPKQQNKAAAHHAMDFGQTIRLSASLAEGIQKC